MRGKVKYVTRSVINVVNPSGHWKPVRVTNTYAVLYNEDKVCIDEDDIREYYGRSRITRYLIEKLNDDFHNKWIEYSCDDDEYWLDGDLSDYI